jgi:hypothetical protein
MRHPFRLIQVPFLLGGVLAAALLGCHDSNDSGSGTSQVRVMLTDAPADYIKSAVVTISRVYLVPGDDESQSVDLLPVTAEPMTFDLLDLRGGIEAFLAEKKVAARSYEQLRLVVDSATVTLVDGVTFDDGSSTRELTVPSGAQTGIKVELAQPIDAGDGMLTIVVVDFDVDRNFVLLGNPATPAGLNGVQFTPTLTEKDRSEVPIP